MPYAIANGSPGGAGQGFAGSTSGPVSGGGWGGNGGSLGQSGATGSTGPSQDPPYLGAGGGGGGAGGNCTTSGSNANITWITPGTRLGTLA